MSSPIFPPQRTAFPHHVFREYDIRGIAGSDISEELAYRLGKAFAAILPQDDQRAVSVARDVRVSGQLLQAALMRGLNDAGRDVIDIGMAPTPLAYYSVFDLDTAGCIVVTASHNPSCDNGFKLMKGQESLHGQDIQQIKKLIQQNLQPSQKKGVITSISIQNNYENFVVADCSLSQQRRNKLKVVIDAGNGPSGIIAAPLYRRIGCDVVELYCQPDGRFPNHHPDPTIEENMRDLAHKVRATGSDLGIAFDGDGDRIGIVDESGVIIWGDMLLLLLARELLKEHPEATIISEIKSSQLLYSGIQQAGGKAIMWRTGHSPIKAKMKETGALLAGEMSGHIFFADRFYGFDDAVYAGARILQLLSTVNHPISTFLHDVPHSEITPEIRISCSDQYKFLYIEDAKKHFLELGYEVIAIDGMRIQYKGGWGLLRASNTQAALVLRFEASDIKCLNEIQALIATWLYSKGIIPSRALEAMQNA
ncbi:MAG: phosphomannomutase/phosphoglucomutase [Mariprofundaceae bacterium]|nr:phosphomannomutase/phosphoglucomutase [Mariprofundaceae bacterium]